MANYNNARVIGDFKVRPSGYGQDGAGSDNQLQRLMDYDKALGHAKHDQLHGAPASFYQIDLYVLTAANAGAKDSASFHAPWPFTIYQADVACESAAGTTGTVDILNGSTSILSAAADVKTAAGVGQKVIPVDGSQDVAYNDAIKIRQTSGSAADMIGGQAHIYAQRL